MSLHENAFHITGSIVLSGGFLSQKSAMSTFFENFCDASLNENLNKQLSCRWFETDTIMFTWHHYNGDLKYTCLA